mmetsp:Transcript_36991/g.109031  ORF Transcript_36991/g.109031 Transcript_36991/m.109031 type:complete len:207 (-) Transcript_36991:76-696(-)
MPWHGAAQRGRASRWARRSRFAPPHLHNIAKCRIHSVHAVGTVLPAAVAGVGVVHHNLERQFSACRHGDRARPHISYAPCECHAISRVPCAELDILADQLHHLAKRGCIVDLELDLLVPGGHLRCRRSCSFGSGRRSFGSGRRSASQGSSDNGAACGTVRPGRARRQARLCHRLRWRGCGASARAVRDRAAVQPPGASRRAGASTP